MHFYCTCGRCIHDITDNIPYKAYLLSDEDEDRYCEAIEAVMRTEDLTMDERVNRIVISLQTRYLSRCIYQCPDCGKLFVDDNDYKLHSFVPEEPVDKQLLTAARED